MQNVLSRYSFLSNTALSEGDVLRNATIQMVSYHDHVQRLLRSIHGVRSRRSRRRWNDIQLTTDSDYVRRMPTTSAFGVKCVNCSALERRYSIFDKAAFVQCVRVDKNLNIHVVRDRKAIVDCRGRCSPVLMKF